MSQKQRLSALDAAPVLRISALDAPAIYSMPLEKIHLPNPEKVLEIC